MKLIFIWRYEQHKFEIRLGRIFKTITSNKSDIVDLKDCEIKLGNMLHLPNFGGTYKKIDLFYM